MFKKLCLNCDVFCYFDILSSHVYIKNPEDFKLYVFYVSGNLLLEYETVQILVRTSFELSFVSKQDFLLLTSPRILKLNKEIKLK